MGDVIDMPSRAEQGMAYLETEIRKLMQAKGESEEAIQIALETLKDVYSRYQGIGALGFEVTLPDGLSDAQTDSIRSQIQTGIELLNDAHGHLLNRLAAELVLTKIKLHDAVVVKPS